jgi:hypothetical protein
MNFRFKEEISAGRLFVIILFKYRYFLVQRKQEAEKIRQKYPERIPVNNKNLFDSMKTNSIGLGGSRTCTKIANS